LRANYKTHLLGASNGTQQILKAGKVRVIGQHVPLTSLPDTLALARGCWV
jgi:hypothetical protein